MHYNTGDDLYTPTDKVWESNYAALLAYGKEHGTYNVPYHFTTNTPEGVALRLGYWLHKQRRMKRNRTLPKSRLAR
jgi:hypothetical protein